MTNQDETYQAYLLRFRRRNTNQPWQCSVRIVMNEFVLDLEAGQMPTVEECRQLEMQLQQLQ